MKRKMRRKVNESFHLICFVYKGDDENYENPIQVKMRLHYDFGLLGDQLGTNFSYAERAEMTETVAVFLTEDYTNLERGDILAFERNEAFTVEYLDPEDDITTKAFLTRLHKDEMAGIVFPGS
jgi:hypothetical protein